MKKAISIITIIIMLCLFASCNKTQTYIKQDNINLNYNNISAGSGCWMDNNFVCSTEHNVGFDLYLTDAKKRQKIDMLSYSYDAHVYNSKLYYFDDSGLSSTEYKFIEYDLSTKNRKNIATATAERIYDYYVVDECLYIVVGKDDNLIRDIVFISLDTGKQITVAQNVFACGIVNGELNYITQNDLKYSVYNYDKDNQNNVLIGEFELSHNIYYDVLFGVNFNSEYVAFAYSDSDTTRSEIYVYRYDDTLVTYDFDGAIIEFIAYNKYAFFSADGNIYRYSFDDNLAEIIVECSAADVSLFVGSDDEVYVSSMDFNGVRRYSVDGKCEDVILN